jgi:serine/threonine protein kinase
LCDANSHYCQQCGFPIGAISFKNEDPMVGKVLPGGYQVLDLLGVGGMGRVYRAEQRTLGRTVAIKVIHPHLLADEKSLARFLTEARATSQLNHPNTVSVIDFGKLDDEKPYLVMEFLRGHNLAQVNNTEGPFELPRIINVLKQVLLALGEAHELQIIHRDLKPENIVLEPLRRGGDFVKVVDFGLAKLKAEGQSGITMPGIVCGTPDFMSPEQGRGDPLDGRSDLYAVGVVLFWLLTGRLPFESDSPTQVVLMHINNPVPDPRSVAPYRSIPESLVQVAFKAMAKSPLDRFLDAHQFADALDACLTQSVRTPAQSLANSRPNGTMVCGACKSVVPTGRFCLECGEPLPTSKRSEPSAADRPLPFLGRGDEVTWLREQLAAASRQRVVAQLVGEPGAGKTRLVWEFLAASATSGHPTVLARPDSYWAEVSGHVLRSILRQLLGNARERLGTSHPDELAALDDLDGKAEGDQRTPAVRRQGFAKLLSWAVTETERDFQATPIIAVDDFQRVDGVSRQAIIDCSRLADGSGLFLFAYHPAFAAHLEDANLRVVNGLPAHVATELLRQASGHRHPVSLAEVGNRGIPPLYVEQVLAFGLDGGHEAPGRLGDLVAQRLATLDPVHQRYVQVLAVLGDDVTGELIGRMLDESVSESTLVRLNELRLVRTSEHGSHSLWHPLFHDMTLHSIPVEARKDLHRRALELFQDQDAPLEVLAEHASGASDTMSALFYIEQLAARAQARGDQESETNALKNALEIARQELFRGQLEDPMRAIAIFGRRLGRVLIRRAQYSDAEGVLLEALDSTEEKGEERVEVLRLLAEVANRRDRHKDARRYVEEALRVAPPELVKELQKDLQRMSA